MHNSTSRRIPSNSCIECTLQHRCVFPLHMLLQPKLLFLFFLLLLVRLICIEKSGSIDINCACTAASSSDTASPLASALASALAFSSDSGGNLARYHFRLLLLLSFASSSSCLFICSAITSVLTYVVIAAVISCASPASCASASSIDSLYSV